MQDDEYQRLVEKLRRIEALFADSGATPGERAAAGEARERIRQRLDQHEPADPAVEFTFTLRNPWSHRLFIALLRRYGIKPYRYARQRRTTVAARLPSRFVNTTLWPEFCELDRTLQAYLGDVTARVIAECVNKDSSDVEVRSGEALPPASSVNLGDDRG